MGGGQICLYVAFHLGKRETQTKFPGNLKKVPGESRDNSVYVFSCSLLFLAKLDSFSFCYVMDAGRQGEGGSTQ